MLPRVARFECSHIVRGAEGGAKTCTQPPNSVSSTTFINETLRVLVSNFIGVTSDICIAYLADALGYASEII